MHPRIMHVAAPDVLFMSSSLYYHNHHCRLLQRVLALLVSMAASSPVCCIECWRCVKQHLPSCSAGYMRDKFVFSLISAVGIFCLGSGVSVWHGVSGLMAAEPVEHLAWSFAGVLMAPTTLLTEMI